MLKSKGLALRQLCEGTEDMQLQDKTELSMEQLGGAGTATFYTIGNNRYSRKAYEAIVKTDKNWQKWARKTGIDQFEGVIDIRCNERRNSSSQSKS